MASEQIVMNETIAKAVAEAMRVAIKAMAATTAERPQSMAGPKIGGPVMRQLTFNWEMENKYRKLTTFRLEGNNLPSKYNTPQTEQLAIIKFLVQFLEMLTDEKIMCSTLKGLFETLTSKFKPQFKETIKALQFCKLSRKGRENAEEWIGRL